MYPPFCPMRQSIAYGGGAGMEYHVGVFSCSLEFMMLVEVQMQAIPVD